MQSIDCGVNFKKIMFFVFIGTNNAFITIALGKEKYQTSVKEKVLQDVDWHEECEM
jgi:hypothetical protein